MLQDASNPLYVFLGALFGALLGCVPWSKIKSYLREKITFPTMSLKTTDDTVNNVRIINVMFNLTGKKGFELSIFVICKPGGA